jgi:hypothetical protein
MERQRNQSPFLIVSVAVVVAVLVFNTACQSTQQSSLLGRWESTDFTRDSHTQPFAGMVLELRPHGDAVIYFTHSEDGRATGTDRAACRYRLRSNTIELTGDLGPADLVIADETLVIRGDQTSPERRGKAAVFHRVGPLRDHAEPKPD